MTETAHDSYTGLYPNPRPYVVSYKANMGAISFRGPDGNTMEVTAYSAEDALTQARVSLQIEVPSGFDVTILGVRPATA